MKIELLGIKYYFHLRKVYNISTKYDYYWRYDDSIEIIGNWTEEMKQYNGKVFHSQEDVIAFCDKIVNSTCLYDCAVKITTTDLNISYKLYRRTVKHHWYKPVEKDIEVISYGLYSKGLFRDTLDGDFSKLIQLEEAEKGEESEREKRHNSKQISKRRDRQHRGKYCLEVV